MTSEHPQITTVSSTEIAADGHRLDARHYATIHRATPANEFAEDATSVCIHCHRDITRVPGGCGPTWVHADTGAVVGTGGGSPQTRSPERTQFLYDVITTAVEGGTGYWARVSQYQWVDTFGYEEVGKVMVSIGTQVGDEARAVLHEMNDAETGYKDEALVLDPDAVARGIGLIERGEISVADRIRKQVIAASGTDDGGMIDADLADVIAQAALLGELRYG